MRPIMVLVVCSGNIHRSVIAQLCLSRELVRIGKEAEFEVLSRGIQGTMDTDAPKYPNLLFYEMECYYTQPCLEVIGIEIPTDQRATPIDEATIEQSSLILAMDVAILRTKENSLTRQFPSHISKMRLFTELVGREEDVPDCGGSNDAVLHQSVVMLINEVAKAGIYNMIRYASES